MNARGAMPMGGVLSISTERRAAAELGSVVPRGASGSFVSLEVRDTGHGLDEATRARIFDPFFTTKEPGKGTGLGLSVVMSIVENLGGALEVESQPSVGTLFRLHFSATERREDAANADAPRGVPGRCGTETILFVDDEESLSDLVPEYLTEAGYAVLTASDGEQALRVLTERERDVDLVITDRGLPGVDGIELCRRVRARDVGMPIILASGFIDPSDQQLLDALNVQRAVQKPYELGELAASIRAVLDASGAEARRRSTKSAALGAPAGASDQRSSRTTSKSAESGAVPRSARLRPSG